VGLKREYPSWGAPKIPEPSFLQQQARFDPFVARYNDERSHEALEMRVPADDYTRSPRPYRGLTELGIRLMTGPRSLPRAGASAMRNAK